MSMADIPSVPDTKSRPLSRRLITVFVKTWDLGLTSFGGPPVHFLIFHKRFVEDYRWIEENTYQELFAICQALPGPASTKLGYCICLTYAGLLPAVLQFVLWCLPGAMGMYATAILVDRIPDTLPAFAYPLLSGLNAAVVGLITVSALVLSEKAITDRLTRCIVIGTACAGLMYSTLWYFPVLMLAGGISTVFWDEWKACTSRIRLPTNDSLEALAPDLCMNANERSAIQSHSRGLSGDTLLVEIPAKEAEVTYFGSPTFGLVIIFLFLVSFIVVVLLRITVVNPPMEFKLFSNLYLAGTIIFGGGPVVVPLLNRYMVSEGWVSSRDFFIGLAVIQSFPGPNFNFAAFLSVLAAKSSSSLPPIVLALIGTCGMYLPGMTLATGVSSLWDTVRQIEIMGFFLRGVNAGAVGLVWTAVYRLWQAGYMKFGVAEGASLGEHPWWIVIAALAFSGNRWFHVPPPIAIALGGCLSVLHWALSEAS